VIYDAGTGDSTGDLSAFVELLVEVDELIATGFVENLPYPHEVGAEMLELLGPKLRAEYRLQRPGWWTPRAGN
jgi:hypothetical protein